MQISHRQYNSDVATHSHGDFHQIIISDFGLLELEVEGRGGVVSGTRMAFVPAGDRHAYRAEGLNRFLVVDVDIDFARRAGLEALWHQHGKASPYLQIAAGQQSLLSALLRLRAADRSDRVAPAGADYLLREDGSICAAISQILSQSCVASLCGSDDDKAAVPVRLRRVLDWADARLSENITVADMAAVAVQSESSFFATFKRHIGTTPMRWLNERRILAAHHLLMAGGSEISMGEIALRVGFTDQSAFSRAFSRRFGYAPSKLWRPSGQKDTRS